jgi:alpha-glucosidase
MSAPWWQSAVVYQIYPRSFCDTTGNGVGDLEGIRQRLEHLAWLGVDAIWVSPFFPSPMKDYGYDVANFCGVDPLFGTLADFDRLLDEAHARGLRVLIDWVPNHTSDQHPWFVDARSSRTAAHRDWYVWRDGDPDQPPNNWRAAFLDSPAWSFDEATRQWYLHLFLAEQPDLDWNNREVVAAMHDSLRFWLDRGVDGFRMDVIHCIGKNPALADHPDAVAKIPACALNDDPLTHSLLREIRSVLAEYPGERVMVGEVFLLSTDAVAAYYGNGDELHLAFNFPPLYAPWKASAWREHIERTEAALADRNAWPTWVLSNHDNPRHRTRYGSEARARAAAMLLLALRGTPFLYAGEELGLEDAVIPDDRRLDPGGRDGCRAPIPWDAAAGHGWAREAAWLPWPPDAGQRNAAVLRADEQSLLHLYRRLLAHRRASPALHGGVTSWLEAPDYVLAFQRVFEGDRWTVLVNFGEEDREVVLAGSWSRVVTSDGHGEGGAFDSLLRGGQAAWLQPRRASR